MHSMTCLVMLGLAIYLGLTLRIAFYGLPDDVRSWSSLVLFGNDPFQGLDGDFS